MNCQNKEKEILSKKNTSHITHFTLHASFRTLHITHYTVLLLFFITHYTLHIQQCYAVEDLIVDNFDTGKTVNNFGGNAGTWNINPVDKSQYCNASFDTKHRRGDKGYCLRLDYDVESVHTYIKDTSHTAEALTGNRDILFTAFNGYFTQLKGADLTDYKYLVFYVKGDKEKGFTRRFKIELKDKAHCAGYIVEWLTDSWQRVSIPLLVFREIADWHALKEIAIVFGPEVTRKVGTIYIENIHFSETKKEPSEEQIKITKTVKPVLINGILKEWKKAVRIKIVPKKHLESGEISGKNDLSAYVWFMWDNEYLYFAARVTDNQIICRKEKSDIWREDCIELFIDPKNDGFVWNNRNDFQIGFTPTGPEDKPQSWAWFQKGETGDAVKKSSKIGKKGYVIEAAIKWSFLNLHPEKGMVLGISPAIHDFDKDETPNGKLNWSYSTKGSKIILGKMVLK